MDGDEASSVPISFKRTDISTSSKTFQDDKYGPEDATVSKNTKDDVSYSHSASATVNNKMCNGSWLSGTKISDLVMTKMQKYLGYHQRKNLQMTSRIVISTTFTFQGFIQNHHGSKFRPFCEICGLSYSQEVCAEWISVTCFFTTVDHAVFLSQAPWSNCGHEIIITVHFIVDHLLTL